MKQKTMHSNHDIIEHKHVAEAKKNLLTQTDYHWFRNNTLLTFTQYSTSHGHKQKCELMKIRL